MGWDSQLRRVIQVIIIVGLGVDSASSGHTMSIVHSRCPRVLTQGAIISAQMLVIMFLIREWC